MQGPSLDNFSLINVGLSERAPYCGCIFNLRADQVLVCSYADCCVLVLMFLFKKPSVLFAFVEILFMWVFQLRSLLMFTPRYLALSMASSACPCNMYLTELDAWIWKCVTLDTYLE